MSQFECMQLSTWYKIPKRSPIQTVLEIIEYSEITTTVVGTWLGGTPASHDLRSWPSQIQPPAKAHPEKLMAQAPRSPVTHMGDRVEFQGPGFRPTLSSPGDHKLSGREPA